VANVLFASFGGFVRHVEAVLKDFADHPDLALTSRLAYASEEHSEKLSRLYLEEIDALTAGRDGLDAEADRVP
ncbi:MAG: hypothetical protein M3478_07370, partial [Planctomycetota bacterium]|nr:hypothetical protein [Planctomycetota bacterium]